MATARSLHDIQGNSPRNGAPLRLLLIEDRLQDGESAVLALERAGFLIESSVAENPGELVALLAARRFDLSLCDLSLPGFTRMEALAIVLQQQPELPVILLADAVTEKEAAAAMSHGAHDVVGRDSLWRLPGAVQRVLKDRATATALEEAQRQLRQVTEQSRQIVQSTRDCIKVLSLDGRLLSMNQEGQQRLGICAFSDVEGQPWVDFWQSSDRATVAGAANKARSGAEGRFEAQFVTMRGEVTWWDVSVTPIRGKEQEITGLLAVSREITKRRAAEDALRNSHDQAQRQLEEIEALYRATPLGLALIDAQSMRLLRVNDGLAAMAQRTPAELTGKRVRELVPLLADEIEALCRQVAKTGEPVRDARHQLETQDESRPVRHWITNYYPVLDREGKVEAISGSAIEITTQRRAEEALRETEKLAAVGRLASSISHEINNPLEAVINLLYLAANSNDLLETRWYLSKAGPELGRISQIATQTLRFHRQATNATPMLPQELVTPVIALYQGRLANSWITVERRDRAELPVTCFEGDIRQVLNNLVGNAIDAMRRGGRLLVRTRGATEWQTGRKGIAITVADTGSGMSPETCKRLYEAFYTTKGISGTGLGMWVSKGIVDKHRGRLTVRSREGDGSGTVFSLFLPYGADER